MAERAWTTALTPQRLLSLRHQQTQLLQAGAHPHNCLALISKEAAGACPAAEQQLHWRRGRVAHVELECTHACLQPALQSRRCQRAGTSVLVSTAKRTGHGVIEVRRADFCGRLCTPQTVRRAMGTVTCDTAETDAAAALGIAVAMRMSRERTAKRSHPGMFQQSACKPIARMDGCKPPVACLRLA